MDELRRAILAVLAANPAGLTFPELLSQTNADTNDLHIALVFLRTDNSVEVVQGSRLILRRPT